MIKIKKPNKKILLLSAAVLILVVGAGGYIYNNRQTKSATQNPEPASQQENINFEPATEEDAKRAEDNKQRIIDSQAKTPPGGSPPPSSSKKAVKPVITYAGQYGQDVEVGGYVNIFEEGGTCTAVFTRGSKSISKAVKAVRGASSVDCPVMSVSAAELAQTGTWSVTVRYDSLAASGISDAKQVEVR